MHCWTVFYILLSWLYSVSGPFSFLHFLWLLLLFLSGCIPHTLPFSLFIPLFTIDLASIMDANLRCDMMTFNPVYN
ncbi:uncharacterized protein BDW47DRAFT_104356 [Aspergillus candidus]|uniref:Uncharacterized protein n=1 Tax=Aspergillus candidus TaxID=41067 RepID=A0A2I2FDV7_ASPCN|nr:hypothetical protein BDW47DRAFT_104356 [Aspergillus candidus]PLB38820.1 hypothetical protein BDW47DRAFT_104356 [Aspergillus candidus]